MNTDAQPNTTAQHFTLDGSKLKLLAICFMFIDHIGAIVLEMVFFNLETQADINAFIATDFGHKIFLLDLFLRFIGRIAFPIFCFLLVEGFLNTKNRKKYTLGLLLFALISEIPFDLAMSNVWLEFNYQNVFFTLFLGILTMTALEKFETNGWTTIVIILCGCGAAYLLKTDYDFIGIASILAFYLYRKNRTQQLLAGGTVAFIQSLDFLGAAALAIIPISRYNGKRGNFRYKYFFYFFYPAHILLLYCVRILCFPL